MLHDQTHSSDLDAKLRLTSKFVHPKVIQVLSHLREPSPIHVPRDDLQPITGDLKNMKTKAEIFTSVRENCPEKKDVSLCLNSNSLLLKRKISKNNVSLE